MQFTDLQRFNSSVLYGAYYNANTADLVVRFNNGSYAGYRGVTPYIWAEFKGAESAGKFYNAHIKDSDRKTFKPSTGFNTKWEKVEDESLKAVEAVKPEFKVSAEVYGTIEIVVEAEDVAKAIAEAERKVKEALSGSNVNVSFKFTAVNPA